MLGRCSAACRPASTIAPTAATSSSIEAASNATRKRSSSSRPIEPGEPNPALIVGPSESIAFSEVPMTAIETSTKSAAASIGASRRWPGIGSQIGSSTAPT